MTVTRGEKLIRTGSRHHVIFYSYGIGREGLPEYYKNINVRD